MTFLRSKRKRN